MDLDLEFPAGVTRYTCGLIKVIFWITIWILDRNQISNKEDNSKITGLTFMNQFVYIGLT